MNTPVDAAFFDIDGTLTTATTMFRFREYLLAAAGEPAQVYRTERGRLADLTAAGAPRSEACRAYYAGYAGADAQQVVALGREWFRRELDIGGFFNERVLTELDEHRRAGRLIVLVSGSFRACLDPVARHVGADVLICSEPLITDGVHTGEIDRPLIGEAKGEAVRDLAARRGIELSRSVAYGDHVSDLPLMRTTGRAVVVGADASMLAEAARRDWRCLPGAAHPDPLFPHTHPSRSGSR